MEEARVVLKWLQSTDDDSKIENEIINFEESKTCKGKIRQNSTYMNQEEAFDVFQKYCFLLQKSASLFNRETTIETN